jgi:hypothetical protein
VVGLALDGLNGTDALGDWMNYLKTIPLRATASQASADAGYPRERLAEKVAADVRGLTVLEIAIQKSEPPYVGCYEVS